MRSWSIPNVFQTFFMTQFSSFFFILGDTQVPTGTDDILVVTARQSEPGILWVNYLKTCFDKITKQRGRVPFK